MSAPGHADTGRGPRFVALLRKPRTLFLGGGAILMPGVIVGVAVGLAAGVGVAVVIALLFLAVVALVADSHAEDDFFAAYAAERSLTHSHDKAELPPATGLLRAGNARYSQRTLAGRLPGGVDGVLSLFTIEVETHDEHRNVALIPYTVVLTEVPGAAELIGELGVYRRSGPGVLDSVDDLFHDKQRVEVESAALDKRAEIIIGADDDLGRARQLLSPTFVDWLATARQHLAFELEAGMLAVSVEKHLDGAAELDEFCENAAHIAERIRSEAAESAREPVAAATFEPAALVEPSGDGVSEQLLNRLMAVLMVVAVLVGGGIAALAGGEDEDEAQGGSIDPAAQSLYEDPDPLDYNDELLAAFPASSPSIATQDELALAAGVSDDVVVEWVVEALYQGWIEHAPGGAYRLTAAGEAYRDSP